MHCYKAKDVRLILGITQKQLTYWVDTGLVIPDGATRIGPHKRIHRKYDMEDIIQLGTIKFLFEFGFTMKLIHELLSFTAMYPYGSEMYPYPEPYYLCKADSAFICHSKKELVRRLEEYIESARDVILVVDVYRITEGIKKRMRDLDSQITAYVR